MRRNVYQIVWHNEASKYFSKIADPKIKEYIIEVLNNVIAQDPFVGKPLLGAYKGVRSYRIGVIRILYSFYKDKLIVVVLSIGHRKNIYKI